MPDLVDMRVMGLLCSRLCHELASPVGAVNNGMELLVDVGDDMRDEAMSLIESSAQRAACRVTFYRMAYGTAGVTEVGDLAHARQITDDLLAEEKLALEWPDADRNPVLKPGRGRMLLNLAVAAAEAMPRGGVLTVAVDESGNGIRLTATARGERLQIHAERRAVFFGEVPVGDLHARNIHSYFTVRLAESLGARVEVTENGDSEIRFEVRLP